MGESQEREEESMKWMLIRYTQKAVGKKAGELGAIQEFAAKNYAKDGTVILVPHSEVDHVELLELATRQRGLERDSLQAQTIREIVKMDATARPAASELIGLLRNCAVWIKEGGNPDFAELIEEILRNRGEWEEAAGA
jgi:hypothetical protein